MGWVVSVTPRPRFLPPGKGPPVPIGQEARAGMDTEDRGKSFAPAGDRTPVVQPVVRHYTASANPAPRRNFEFYKTREFVI
jgi:hypothetical protein